MRLRVLALSERAFGVGHSEVGLALDGLVALYREQGKLAEVEGQYKRALRLREAALVPERSGLIAVLAPLADLYDEQRRFVEAYPLHLRVVTISNDLFAPNDKKVVSALDRLVASDSQLIKNRSEETQLKRALEIAEIVLGIVHPVTERTLGELEKLYRD